MSRVKDTNETQAKLVAILDNLSKEERQLLTDVLIAERAKLYMGLPRGIHEDLWRIVTETIR